MPLKFLNVPGAVLPGLLVLLLLLPGGLMAQQGAGLPVEGATVEGPRFVAGVSMAAVRFSGETWPRAGVWAEAALRPGVAAWGEVWGVRRPALICPGGSPNPQCGETSDAVGWALGARVYQPLGTGELWGGAGVGRNRFDGPVGRLRYTGTHFQAGYRLSVGDRWTVSPRVGLDQFVGESGWFHLGVEAGLRF